MSELQAEETGSQDNFTGTIEIDDGPAATEPEQSGADLATDSPEKGEENTEDSKQEGFNKAMNKQVFKFRNEERRAIKAEAEAEDLRQQLQTNKSVNPENIVIPVHPDTWDENYEAKIKARDDAIRTKATAEASKNQATQNTALEQQRQQLQQAEQTRQLQTKFVESAKELGVDTVALNAAQVVLRDYGISAELATTIMEDKESGPLIVQYLAANMLDLHDLVTMQPLQAGMKFAQVKQKAMALKSKHSGAPPPAETLKGRAAKEGQRGPKGATFE